MCIIGYLSLAKAIEKLSDGIEVELSWLPFEINPSMTKEGQNVSRYLSEKYGMSPAQQLENISNIEQRGAELGFVFKPMAQRHIYNSFDCHVLLHVAQGMGKQTALKALLFDAYFKRGLDISDHQVLIDAAVSVGMSVKEATDALSNDEIKSELRHVMEQVKDAGITSVPTLIVNQEYAINGARTPQEYADLLNEIADK